MGAGSTLLKIVIIPHAPVTGTSIITSSRGAHIRGMAFTSGPQSQTTSSQSGSTTLLGQHRGLPNPGRELPLSLSHPSLVQ